MMDIRGSAPKVLLSSLKRREKKKSNWILGKEWLVCGIIRSGARTSQKGCECYDLAAAGKQKRARNYWLVPRENLLSFYDFWIVLHFSCSDWPNVRARPIRLLDLPTYRRTATEKKWQTWRKRCDWSTLANKTQGRRGNKRRKKKWKEGVWKSWKVPCRRPMKSADLRWGIQHENSIHSDNSHA